MLLDLWPLFTPAAPPAGISGGDFIPPTVLMMDTWSRARLHLLPQAAPRWALGGLSVLPLDLTVHANPGLLTGTQQARIGFEHRSVSTVDDEETAILGGWLWRKKTP